MPNLIIYSKRMCNYLMLRGFVLLAIDNNTKSRNKIFIFKNSPEIKQVMSEFKDDKEFHIFAESLKNRRE